MCVHLFFVGYNNEHIWEESSRAHDNNGTYILVYTMFIVILQFIEVMAQADTITFDDQTDSMLLYAYYLTST